MRRTAQILRTPAVLGALLAAWFAAVAATCCLPLLRSDRILSTQANDLANHVRLVYESKLALREGQFPPLVAPALEGGARVPVFQYYSGTAYILPGALTLVGVGPYAALKLVVFLHLLAAGWFACLACARLGVTLPVALIAGTAYETFPFAGCDLIARGSYTEFLALETVPLVFSCGLCLIQAMAGRERRLWFCCTGLALAYFIPLHPVQTLLCGLLVLLLLAAHAMLDRREGWQGPRRLVAALAAAVAASAWYWVPIARDRAQLRVSPHAGLFDAGLASFKVLLWPVYLRPEQWPWGPQLGLHFGIAAASVIALTVQRKSRGNWPRWTAVVSAAALVLILAIIRGYEHVPAWLFHLLKPIQWTYRLLIPAALAGTLCLALSLDLLPIRRRKPWPRRAMLALTLVYVVAISPAYFAGQASPNGTPVVEVIAGHFVSPNTSAYALRGTNYRDLAFVRPDGTLNTGTRIAIPFEGHPTEVDLVLRAEDPAAEDVDLVLGDPTDPMDARNPELPRLKAERRSPDPLVWSDPADRTLEKSAGPGGRLRLSFSFVPTVGLVPADTALRFESRPANVKWVVEDLTFRGVGEPAARGCRLPDQVEKVRRGARTQLAVDVAAGREGLYQLPVYYLPSNEVLVNGVRQGHPPVANRAMTVAPLRLGRNVIKIRTRPTAWAWRTSALACAALAAGALLTAVPKQAASGDTTKDS